MLVATLLSVVAVACQDKHATVAVADAPASRALAMTLERGTIRHDVRGTFKLPCAPSPRGGASTPTCSDSYFTVFAVVPDGWTKGNPVPAWLTCASERLVDACDARVRAHAGSPSGRVAVRVGDGDKLGRAVSGWEKAIDDAVVQHGVSAAEGGPVISLPALGQP